MLKLLQDIGAVVFDANNRLVLSAFFTNNEQKGSLSRILGYAAEGVVVREHPKKKTPKKEVGTYEYHLFHFFCLVLVSHFIQFYY